MVDSWSPFAEGRTLGSIGSEGGRVLLDEEHPAGARIPLEPIESPPFAVTCGLAGWMFHPRFFADEAAARAESAHMRQALAKLGALEASSGPGDAHFAAMVDGIARFVEELP